MFVTYMTKKKIRSDPKSGLNRDLYKQTQCVNIYRAGTEDTYVGNQKYKATKKKSNNGSIFIGY